MTIIDGGENQKTPREAFFIGKLKLADGDDGLAGAAAVEFGDFGDFEADVTRLHGEDGVIFANSGTRTGYHVASALADNDAAGAYHLTTKKLNAEAL
jgi:hypothetical protein